jgi:transposase
LKELYWDGSGLCLFAKRLERHKFIGPPIVDGTLTLTPAQLALHPAQHLANFSGFLQADGYAGFEALYEDKARFAPPAERLAHRAAAIPLLDAFFAWAEAIARKLSARSALAEALRYIIKRRTALTRYLTDARLEAGNNIAENAIRCIALGRRNWLFAGSNSGGKRGAATYSILQTAKLNDVNPEAYLTDTLSRIADGHPINRIGELLPWSYQRLKTETAP